MKLYPRLKPGQYRIHKERIGKKRTHCELCGKKLKHPETDIRKVAICPKCLCRQYH